MALFPDPKELGPGLDPEKLASWDYLMEVRNAVLKNLEEARQSKLIGAPLEARVLIMAEMKLPLLQQYEALLPSLFIVSQVALSFSGTGDQIRIVIERADGTKCERCWKYSTKVGEDPQFPTVCDNCATALREMGLS